MIAVAVAAAAAAAADVFAAAPVSISIAVVGFSYFCRCDPVTAGRDGVIRAGVLALCRVLMTQWLNATDEERRKEDTGVRAAYSEPSLYRFRITIFQLTVYGTVFDIISVVNCVYLLDRHLNR